MQEDLITGNVRRDWDSFEDDKADSTTLECIAPYTAGHLTLFSFYYDALQDSSLKTVLMLKGVGSVCPQYILHYSNTLGITMLLPSYVDSFIKPVVGNYGFHKSQIAVDICIEPDLGELSIVHLWHGTRLWKIASPASVHNLIPLSHLRHLALASYINCYMMFFYIGFIHMANGWYLTHGRRLLDTGFGKRLIHISASHFSS